MNVLVTGGAGFIGSNLSTRLVELGHGVKILDNFSTGKKENLIAIKDDVEIIDGDIRNYEQVLSAASGVEVVFHLAALPSVPRSIIDPLSTSDVNTTGTLNLLLASKAQRVRRLVFASSSSVYGDTPTLPKREEMTPMPMSPYAVSKLAAENYCRVFSIVYGFETVALRYFNVFGPRQDPTSQYAAVIPKFIKALINGESPIIYGDGNQSRDFTYVENVVDANLQAATTQFEPGLVMNCATQGQVTLNELVYHLNKLLGTQIAPKHVEPRKGDIKHSFADISKIKKVLGYRPGVDFESGLMRTIESYKKSFQAK